MKIPKAKKLPSGNWNIYLRLGGQNISVTAPTETECKTKAQQIKADYLAGEKVSKSPTATVKQLADRYIDERRSVLSPSTVFGYQIIIDRYKHLHDQRANKVNWQIEVNTMARKYSAKTLKNDFGLWRSILRNAGHEMPQLRLPQIVPEEHPWLTPEQIPLFLEAIKGGKMEIGALLALHGLRLSELLALEKGSVWGGVIYVRGAVVRSEDGVVSKPTNKNISSRRTVPVMIPRLQTLVDAAPDGPLHRYGPGSLYPFINRACEAAGLPKVGVHGLRHSAVSLAYHCGLSALQSQKIFGYADMGTMRKIYTHLSEKDREAGADKLKAFFDNADKTQTHKK